LGAGNDFEAPEKKRMERHFDTVRFPFVANSGQTDPSVAYYASTFAGTVFVTKDGQIVYSLPGRRAASRGTKAFDANRSLERPGWSLTETPLGAKALPRGAEPSPTQVSYFLGNDPARWKSDTSTYQAISLGEIWPGIRMELRARGRNVEKVFTVEPRGDPSRIRIRIRGARLLRIDAGGELVASAGPGRVTFTRPVAYQEYKGSLRKVEIAYRVRGGAYGFRLGDYDPSLPVVIDPLVQATYLGGSGFDRARATAIHPITGDVYVAGSAESDDFPGTTGGAQSTKSGFTDAFVARLTADLTTLTRATYLGGRGDDGALALAIHARSGDVYIAGATNSGDLPGTAGGAQPSFGGGFVARLTADLTTLTKTTYLGGHDDFPYALAIHPISGDLYAAGVNGFGDFPGTAGGAQSVRGGGSTDCFVARLTADLTGLTKATYLGGKDDDEATALAIQPTSGDVYIAGFTSSPNFPGTAGAAQAVHRGSFDAFVARLTADLTTLTRATFLGGSGWDQAFSLVIHPSSGDVYVAGLTSSKDFPGTSGGAQPAIGGGEDAVIFEDAFVARLAADLRTLTMATYLGGSDGDQAHDLAVHPASGDVYVAGSTRSRDFPGTTFAPPQPISQNSFVARLPANLTSLTRATYLGSSYDETSALAIHPVSGDIFVAGDTVATDFPGTTGGAQLASGGGFDAFVARWTADLETCSHGTTTLCLNKGRFKVQVQWTVPQAFAKASQPFAETGSGSGQGVALTSDTGYFWFFSPNNVEVVVKVVDGRAFNNRFWVFAAGLTDVAAVMTVTDTQTGAVKAYQNPPGTPFEPIQDTDAFSVTLEEAAKSPGGGNAAQAAMISEGLPRLFASGAARERLPEPWAAATTACTPGGTTLCLNGNRFQVRVTWATPDGRVGSGQATPLTSDTGYFWFFSANDAEVVVKAVTGCPSNNRFWLFAGGLTNVNVVMTVIDTQTGEVKTYTNPQSAPFQPIQDTSAFGCL
jgi:hypothetical protein